MIRQRISHAIRHALCAAFTLACLSITAPTPATAQMVTGASIPGYAETMGVDIKNPPKDYMVEQIAVTAGASTGANVLWPGETGVFSLRINNTGAAPIIGPAAVHVIGYGTRGTPGDVWTPQMFRISVESDVKLNLNVPAKGSQIVTVTPKIPARFGGYALVLDIPGEGATVAVNLVRTLPADSGSVQFPTYALDLPFTSPVEAMTVLQRLGVKGFRCEFGYSGTFEPDYQTKMQQYEDYFKQIKAHDLTAMLTIEGSKYEPMSTQFRSYLNDKAEGQFTYPGDVVWPPKYDTDVRKWARDIAANLGWPKGPVNAVELWNEPWNGISISGWGADDERFREIYEQLALGVRDARANDGTWVLSGGACSSTNTRDKLFGDGGTKFLPLLDFVSIHYQPMAADPSIDKLWHDRPASMGGPVRVWDTESWIGNTDDHVGGVIATMRSLGQSRTAGIFQGNVYAVNSVNVDNKPINIVQVYSPGAALAATQKFIGQRPFKQLVIKGGLPWVFEFGGRPLSPDGLTEGSPDDGTIVVTGDIGAFSERGRTLFRTVYGLKNQADVDAAQKALAALPAGSPDYSKAQGALAAASILHDAAMTIRAEKDFSLYDFYGNPVPAKGAKIVIPLKDSGYFLRTDGSRGSMDRLRAAVAAGRIDGIEPVEIVAHDMLRPIASKPELRITVRNVLNRPVTGVLKVSIGRFPAFFETPINSGVVPMIKLDSNTKQMTIPPQTAQDVVFTVTGGADLADNRYPLHATFDAGPDGVTPHYEDMRVNFVARRTITADGDLSDWKGIIPQPVSGAGIQASLTEQAWLPFENFKTGTGSGVASGYLAYDDQNFYFAAKVADNTPFEGLPRFETRDDDQYFYPAVSYNLADHHKEMDWPADTRRYSYRKDPDLPATSFPDRDNILIAFNVVPEDQKSDMYEFPAGTEPHYMVYKDTDYEYALNPVAAKYGGGTEIWRLNTPGMPRKTFYPRQPKSSYDGPVKDGKLVINRQGDTLIYECSIPWTEMPLVKAAVDAGKPVRFSFRVNDNAGPSYELANERSVSKINAFAFHDDFEQHWANELEFGFGK